MLIGILQCGHTPEEVAATHGDFDDMFHRLFHGQGFSFQTWNVVDMDFPSDVTQAEGWLITGSRHGAYEDHAFIPPLEAFIRDIHQSGRRMVGICFGHQIIAQALGGTVEKFEGGWAVGRHGYEIANVGPMALNAFHQDQVTQAPDGAEVTGHSPFCANAALVYGDRIFTVQPHPEITNDVLGAYLRAPRVIEAVPADKREIAEAERVRPTDADTMAMMLGRFLREGRTA
ncbi:MAG: type 1 glutamine amidotransferase [Shimia sp.]